MGYTRVEAGDFVRGHGTSPSTGKRIEGIVGYVTHVYGHLGDDIVCVEWENGTKDQVRQENVSGTRQGVSAHVRGIKAKYESGGQEQEPKKRRFWGRK